LEWISPLADKAEKILDVGGESPFTKIIRQRWPGKLSPYYFGDLRDGFLIRDCDLIICAEVLEHIADREAAELQTEWNGTGTHMLLASCWLSLRPGGMLFLSTPNAASTTSLKHLLYGEPAFIYRPHVREYCPREIKEMVSAVGFKIERFATFDIWNNAITQQQRDEIVKFLKHGGYSLDERGEDVFALCRKPAETTRAA